MSRKLSYELNSPEKMASTYIIVVLVYIANCFNYAESVKCIRCSSKDYDSPCRLGTDKTEFECPADEQSCYLEYFYGGDEPLYRRGCSPSDWCEQQTELHGDHLKYCKTCDGEKCNTDRIGGPDKTQIQCYSCSTENVYDDCRKGGIRNPMKLCGPGEECGYDYVSTTKRNIWTRGCAKIGYCASKEETYKNSLETCGTCKNDLCNNKELDVAP